jgi:hypothetical protein
MTARTGMVDLLTELRGMTHAGTADYSVAAVSYWSDDQLQQVLDRARQDYYRASLAAQETYEGGSVVYKTYFTGVENLEKTTGGTTIFWLEDGAGNRVGTAQYSVDYQRGEVTFGENTGGSALYWSGRAYDLNRAAANVWRQKAGHYAGMYTFSTDNHKVEKGALQEHALKMAAYYEQQSSTPVVTTLYRSDTC